VSNIFVQYSDLWNSYIEATYILYYFSVENIDIFSQNKSKK